MSQADPMHPDVASVFLALANRDRLQLLHVMRTHHAVHGADSPGMPINALAHEAELSRFSASRHLAILRQTGLVTADRVGLAVLHSLAPARFELLEDWLYPFLDLMEPSATVAGQPR